MFVHGTLRVHRRGCRTHSARAQRTHLRVHQRDAADAEPVPALGRLGVDPVLVDRVVLVGLVVREEPGVLDEVGVQDAVRGVAGRLGNGTERHRLLRREEVERALEAAAHARVDDPHVTGEAFRAAVDQRDDRPVYIHIYTHTYIYIYIPIYIPSCSQEGEAALSA